MMRQIFLKFKIDLASQHIWQCWARATFSLVRATATCVSEPYIAVYSRTTQKNLSKVFRMQKKATRTINKSRYNTPTSQLFAQLKILPLEHLLTPNKGILIHSIYYKTSPPSLHGIWQTNQQRGIDCDLCDAHQLYLPFARTDHVKRLPYFSFPKTWNNLPDCKLSSNSTTSTSIA